MPKPRTKDAPPPAASQMRNEGRRRALGEPEPRQGPGPEQRRAGVLDVAERLFKEKGFSATTMAMVAAACGMSKKTLYKLFDSKEDLFRSIVRLRLSNSLQERTEDEKPASEQLRACLRRFGNVVLSPDEIALHRLIVRETQVAPDLAQIFTQNLLRLGPRQLVEIVHRLDLRAPFDALPLSEVAEMLLGIVYGSTHFKLMIDDGFRLDPQAVERRIDLVVALCCADIQG